jgi:putative endonuclease
MAITHAVCCHAAMARSCRVYMLSSRSRNLYIGVTSDLLRRLWQHRNHAVPGHCARYRITRLVYYEEIDDIVAAIAREKQLKGWLRARKLALIEAANPTWEDLARDWYG